MTFTPQQALQRAIEHREIFFDEMVELMRQIMRGEVSPSMTSAILTGLRVKKETVGEIAAAATVLREFARPVAVADRSRLVDIVGTGGDGAHTFNISTAAMFVVAAAGAKAGASPLRRAPTAPRRSTPRRPRSMRPASAPRTPRRRTSAVNAARASANTARAVKAASSARARASPSG